MTLPVDPKAKWPPDSEADALSEITLHSAWYSGDPVQLAEAYGGTVAAYLNQVQQPTRRWYQFWSRKSSSGRDFGRLKLHVPIAGDLASASADLLFSEPPNFEDLGKRELEAIDVLADATGFYRTLLEGAELCSALGGIYLVPRWRKALTEHPFLALVHPDAAVPRFEFDRLVAVVFWSTIRQDGTEVVRHLESHDVVDGQTVISHAVYRGSKNELGNIMGDAELLAMTGLEPTIETGIERLDVSYVPNMRPNRRFRTLPYGRSDLQGGEGLMDALDEAWTSWMRDIRLGQSRIFVPSQYLERRARRGDLPYFDIDQEAFTPLAVDPNDVQGKSIEHVQPELRVEAHSQTCMDLIERIVARVWSPQTFGIGIEGRAESGTALNVRERKTFITREKKRAYWQPAVEEQVENLLVLERDIFGQQVTPGRPRVGWPETLGNDQLILAQTIDLFRRAQAMSIYSAVKAKNPDWSEDEIEAEVTKIQDETGQSVPDALGVGALP